MPAKQFPLPHANQAWVDPATGLPTQTFYQFMASAFPRGVDVLADVLRLTPLLFRQLPARPVEGMLASVSDSAANTFGATVTGGGGSNVLAYYNGRHWTVAGI
jgi:hypothetical protein